MVKRKICSVKNCHFHVGWVWRVPTMTSPKSILFPTLFQSHYSFGKQCIRHDISNISANFCGQKDTLSVIDNRVAMHEARLTLKSSQAASCGSVWRICVINLKMSEICMGFPLERLNFACKIWLNDCKCDLSFKNLAK